MAKSIGKIDLGRKNKRSFIDLSHKVDSTLSYGFAEPTMCLDLIPDAKIDLTAYPGIRLAPLPQPTTGTIAVKNYYSFVKTKDVFEAFENLQSGTTVRTSRGSYIPTYANVIDNFKLFAFLLKLNRFNFFKLYETEYTNRDLNGVFFTFSLNCNYDLWTGESANVHNLFDDVVKQGAGTAGNYEPLKALQAFWQTVASCASIADYYLHGVLDYGAGFEMDEVHGDNHMFTSNVLYGGVSDYFNATPDVSPWTTYSWYPYVEWLRNLKQTDLAIFSQGRSYENADFIFKVPNTVTEGGESHNVNYFRANAVNGAELLTSEGKQMYIGIHLTPAGKRLFKIFNALEYNFGVQAGIEFDKLLAYYKAWFDIFNPGRNIQWKDTNAYNIIHAFYDSPEWSFETVDNYMMTAPNAGTFLFDEALEVSYREFFTDLVECYFTEKVDPITVALPQPVLDNQTVNGSAGITLYINSNPGDYREASQRIVDGYGSNDDDIGGLSVRFLQSLYNLVNKNSVIGQRVALYMKEHFGIDIPKTTFIDVKDFEVNIVDAVATVNNDQTHLAEYGGLGKGKDSHKIKYETKDFGYFFQFAVVVPIGGYVQAGKLAKRNRLDWYQPEYDSLGMEPISQYEVNSRNSVVASWQKINNVFGFRPRFFSWKYKNNLANGGFSFRSERSGFLGYSMDKVFSEPDYLLNETVRGGNDDTPAIVVGNLRYYEGAQLAPDEELRYIGKNESYGNYNRIFYDTSGATDNFIYFCHNDLKMWAPMKPIRSSFETYDETSDTDTIGVEHS